MSPSESSAERLSYGTEAVTRVLSIAVGVSLLVAAILVLAVDSSKPLLGNRIPAAGILVIGSLAVYVIGVRSGLDVDERCVTVRTFIGTTVRFPTADLDHAEGGPTLWLHRRSGDSVSVRALSKTNLSVLLNRPGRTDRVAAEINAFLKRASSG